jgi:glycosyltransferase involved in cell wall biosynthesis
MKRSDIQLIITSLAPEPVYHHGKTGGDVRLMEIFRHLGKNNEINILCISTSYNRKNFETNGICAEFRIVKTSLKFKGFVGLCLKSLLIMAKSFFFLETDFLENKGRQVVLYSSSDLFWEVIPAFYFKVRKKNVKWMQAIHHVYPDWKERLGNKVVNFFGYYLQRFSFWLIRKKADKIVVVNSLVRIELIKLGFLADRIFISSNGIDLEYFENIERAEISYEGVFLGRLSHSKGLADLVEIWKSVCREMPGAKMAVIGGESKETKNFLLEKIKDSGMENNIDLLGFLEDKKAYSILKSGKVFLFPSHEEGWGIAVAEAMACGLPVVSWDLPVYREIFKGYTFQIKENDIAKFSTQAVALLKDEKMREKIGSKGKEFIKKYSWNEVAKKEMDIIRS